MKVRCDTLANSVLLASTYVGNHLFLSKVKRVYHGYKNHRGFYFCLQRGGTTEELGLGGLPPPGNNAMVEKKKLRLVSMKSSGAICEISLSTFDWMPPLSSPRFNSSLPLWLCSTQRDLYKCTSTHKYFKYISFVAPTTTHYSVDLLSYLLGNDRCHCQERIDGAAS